MSPRTFFFSPKGRLTVSRRLAIAMNTLNLLAPTLLLAALILAASAKLADHPIEVKRLLARYAVAAISAALVVRVIWGLGIRIARKKSGNP